MSGFGFKFDGLKLKFPIISEKEIQTIAKRELVTTIASNNAKLQQGNQPDGTAQPRYSPGYALAKGAATKLAKHTYKTWDWDSKQEGRSTKRTKGARRGRAAGVSAIIVNLTVTGELKRSMKATETTGGAEALFSGQHKPKVSKRAKREARAAKAVAFTLTNAQGKQISFFSTAKHRTSGGSTRSGISNAQLAAKHEGDGRIFRGFGPDDLARIYKTWEVAVEKAIKKTFDIK